MADIEQQVRDSTGAELPEAEGEMTVRQRRVIPLSMTIRSVLTLYPKRTVLGLGGIIGPLLFSKLVSSGKYSEAALGFIIGAGMMIVGGIVEIFYGIKAEGSGSGGHRNAAHGRIRIVRRGGGPPPRRRPRPSSSRCPRARCAR